MYRSRTLIGSSLLLFTLAACQDQSAITAPGEMQLRGPSFVFSEASPIVNSTLDDGTGCTEVKCTLRDAIEFASSGATITFAIPGTGPDTINLATTITVSKSLTIAGSGQTRLVVARPAAAATGFVVFNLLSGHTISISRLTITGGMGFWGGGIFSAANLSLDSVLIYNNTASDKGGGMYLTTGPIAITNSTIYYNSAVEGGGVFINAGTVSISRTNFWSNWASAHGGGIVNRGNLLVTDSEMIGNGAVSSGGGVANTSMATFTRSSVRSGTAGFGGGFANSGSSQLVLINSTLSGNTAVQQGGAIYHPQGSVFTATHTTITGNTAYAGGGIYALAAATFRGSIVAGNTINPEIVASPDIAGFLATATFSLVGDNAFTSITATALNGNIVGVDAKLEAIAANGGFGGTHALQAGSPAFDSGICTDHLDAAVTVDQRGETRPKGVTCDMGAYEAEPPPSVPTSTSLTASPASPQPFGTSVTFTATVAVTTGGAAVTSGTVAFITAGTCAAPTVTLGSGVALNAAGQATLSTSALSVGNHTVTACYSGAAGFDASNGGMSYAVTLIATTTTLSISPSTQQYSDSVTVSASVLPAAATGSVQFQRSVHGGAFADIGSAVSVVSGAASMKYQSVDSAGSAVQFKAVFSGTGNYAGSTADAKALTTTREKATITFGTNPTALQVSSAGGILNSGALILTLSIREKTPDLAASPGTPGIGSIANAGLAVTLAPVGPGGSYALVCTPGSISGTGYATARSFSCTNAVALPVNAYEVQASVTGPYYTGTGADAFTVYDPSLGFVTGGGTFMLGGDKVNFGFTMKYNKKATSLSGNLIVLRHHSDGTVSRLKSNALGSLALGSDDNVAMGWASFDGKATYTTWDAGAGDYATVGNQSFTIYAEDRNNPGSGIDRIWVGGPGLLKMTGALSAAGTNAAALTGGDVSAPHGSKGGGKNK